MIAMDLDGTLLNSYGEVSAENKNAIQKAIENDVNVIIASGRPLTSTLNIAIELGTNSYLISDNGAIIYDMQKEEVIYRNYLSRDKVLEIIKLCDKNNIYYCVYTEDTIITKNLNYNVLFYYNENKHKKEGMKTHINIVEDVYQYVEKSEKNNFSKITVCDEDKIIFSGILKKMKKIKKVDVLDVEHMSKKKIVNGTMTVDIEYFYTEITQENTNKWNAIETILDKLGIYNHDVITIGDNANDIEMIKNAGLGIAVNNSAPYIKEIADDIVADNDKNGVSEAIEKYITISLQ
jgi:Cof subfamily protein (haloacid dehalogenase superfamily)